MRLFALCPGQEDPAGAREVHRVVDAVGALAYEAHTVHPGTPEGAPPACALAPQPPPLLDFPDAPDTLVLVRNEDVLTVLDVKLSKVALWWVEVVDFPVELERVGEEWGWGSGLSTLVHGAVFTHLAADATAQQYLATRGCAFGALDANADDPTLRQQVFDLLAEQDAKHLTASQWAK